MKRNVMVGIGLMAATICGGTAVMAAHGPAGGECGEHRGAERGPGGFYVRMAKILKLTDEQQNQIKSLFSAEQVASKPFRDKIHENRRALMQAGDAATFDEAYVRDLAGSMAQAETELAVIRVKTQSRVRAVMTAEQRELLNSIRPEMDRMPPPPPPGGSGE